MARSSTFRWFILGILAVAVIAAVALGRSGAWWGSREAVSSEEAAAPAAEPETPPVPVTVARVELWTVPRTVEVVGTFRGEEEVNVAAKVAGRAIKVLRDVGDVVRPGDPLLAIDPTDFQLAVDEARGNMLSELAKIGLTSMPEGDLDPAKVFTVVRAENLKKNFASKLDRAAKLREKETITQEEYDQVETEYKVAEANYRQAEVDARATLAAARQKQAVLATAEQRLRDATVVAPTPTKAPPGGVPVQYAVAARNVYEGEMVAAGGPGALFRLVMDTSLELLATVPERYIAELQAGQPVEIAVDAYPGRKFEGKVSRVSPAVDRTSRTFQVEIAVANANRDLKAGGFAKASILSGKEAQARLVPSTAVVSFAGVDKVFVVREGKARQTPVALGVAGRGWREVKGKLGPEDQVVTFGHSQLADGSPVRVRQTEGPLKVVDEDLPWKDTYQRGAGTAGGP